MHNYSVSFVSRRHKMRRFVEIWHMELLASVERLGNVVYCGGKKFSFILNTDEDTALGRPASAGSQILEKARKTQLTPPDRVTKFSVPA